MPFEKVVSYPEILKKLHPSMKASAKNTWLFRDPSHESPIQSFFIYKHQDLLFFGVKCNDSVLKSLPPALYNQNNTWNLQETLLVKNPAFNLRPVFSDHGLAACFMNVLINQMSSPSVFDEIVKICELDLDQAYSPTCLPAWIKLNSPLMANYTLHYTTDKNALIQAVALESSPAFSLTLKVKNQSVLCGKLRDEHQLDFPTDQDLVVNDTETGVKLINALGKMDKSFNTPASALIVELQKIEAQTHAKSSRKMLSFRRKPPEGEATVKSRAKCSLM